MVEKEWIQDLFQSFLTKQNDKKTPNKRSKKTIQFRFVLVGREFYITKHININA